MISIAMHVLHIAGTCTSLGGLFYARMVLWPNMRYIPAEAREQYLRKMINRYAWIKWTGIGIVTATGIGQWLEIYPQVAEPGKYLAAFTFKMLCALGLFSITFLLALPAEKLKGMQRRRGFWSGLNILCGLGLLAGAALMRAVRMGQL